MCGSSAEQPLRHDDDGGQEDWPAEPSCCSEELRNCTPHHLPRQDAQTNTNVETTRGEHKHTHILTNQPNRVSFLKNDGTERKNVQDVKTVKQNQLSVFKSVYSGFLNETTCNDRAGSFKVKEIQPAMDHITLWGCF